MKKIIVFLILFFQVVLGFSQSQSDISKIALSLVMPDNVEGLNTLSLSKIETKITQIVSNSGLAASGYENNFVIYPKFSINETSVVEGGMADITVVNCELSLFIKEVDNNVLFASISKPIRGSGKDKLLAITSAITKINTNDNDYKQFIDNGKQKIIQYYESKCSDLMSKAESLVKMDNFSEAFGLLMTIPQEVACYSKAQGKSIEYYKLYKEKECNKLLTQAKMEFEKDNFTDGIDLISKIDPSTKCYSEAQELIKKKQEKLCKEYLQKAKTSIASQDYVSASTYLGNINPETSCYNDAQALIKEVQSKITIAEKRDFEFKKEQYRDNVQLDKQRIQAAKEIAISYYKQKPQTINYTYLVR